MNERLKEKRQESTIWKEDYNYKLKRNERKMKEGKTGEIVS